MTNKDFELVLPFDRDQPEFARGVEIGMLYERLRSGFLPVEAMVNEANIEMILRLAETFGVSAKSEDHGGDWLTVTFR